MAGKTKEEETRMPYFSKLNLEDDFGEPVKVCYGLRFYGTAWVTYGHFIVQSEYCRLPQSVEMEFRANCEWVLRYGKLDGSPSEKLREKIWAYLQPAAGLQRPVQSDGVATLADSFLRLSGLENPVWVDMGYAHPFVGDSISTEGSQSPVYFRRDGAVVALIMPLSEGPVDGPDCEPGGMNHQPVEDWLRHYMALKPDERNP